MAERLLRALPVLVANHVKARQSLIERAVSWLATETGWAWSKRCAICNSKLCGGFTIFGQWCPCGVDMCYGKSQKMLNLGNNWRDLWPWNWKLWHCI